MRAFLLAWMLLLITTSASLAQSDSLGMAPRNYNSGLGMEVMLTNNGFGLGGYGTKAIGDNTSLLLDISVVAGKDQREFRFFSYFGDSYVPYKYNYLTMMPIYAGIQRRLWAEKIEDNFRPFIQVAAGPVLGWEYPYFKDCNGNNRYDETVPCPDGGYDEVYGFFGSLGRGHFRPAAGGMLALGASFGRGRRTSQSVRIGYSFQYFFDDIQLMEHQVEGHSRKFFGSPSISFLFGRISR